MAEPGSASGGSAAEGTGNIGPWSASWQPEPALERAFTDLVDAVRRVQDLVAGARPTVPVSQQTAALLRAAGDQLAAFQVGEAEQLAGKLAHLPGRAQSLVPPVRYMRSEADRVEAHVTFTRFYLGGGGAVHGGAIPLLFDELLGRLAGAGGRARSRTAYLKVNYRNITPLDRELQLRGSLDRLEGRKMWITGSLYDGDSLLCDADGLFLFLNPGQP
jgi:acyl-coenzyme A thioesterase PaaI-like protein